MAKKIIALVILSSFVNLVVNCSTTGGRANQDTHLRFSSNELNASKFPEVLLTLTSKASYRGKITKLLYEELTLLPFPYWNVEPIKINVDGVHSIKLIEDRSKAGDGFGVGFALGFLITGIIGGAASKYNSDYRIAFLGSIIMGLCGGLLGLSIEGIASIAHKSQYDLDKMSKYEKTEAIKEIMGLNN